MKTLILSTFIFVSSTSFALVDMKNANYSETWVDIEIPSHAFPLKVERAYNSRSLNNGLFGFGWCSNFETSLEFTAEGNIRYVECGDGMEILFTPASFDRKDVEKTVATIMQAIQKDRSFQGKALQNIALQLRTDENLRNEYAMKYKLLRAPSDKTQYYGNGQKNDLIVRDRGFYSRSLPDGTTQKFDLQGQLLSFNDKNGNTLRYVYRNGLIYEASDSTGKKLTFEYYPNKKVKQILGPNKMSAFYKYENVSDLSFAQDSRGESFSYKYDDLHNLTLIAFADKTTKRLGYDKNRDWVTSFTDRNGCLESYGYTSSKDDPKNHFFSSIEKKCGKTITNKSRYEFVYKNKPSGGGVYLAHVGSEINKVKTETDYHPVFEKPLTVTTNGNKTSFTYYDDGLVKTRTFGKLTTLFKYDPKNKKVAEVRTGNQSTNFRYDSAGNLIFARASSGQEVALSYDAKGRIISLVDQAKRRVNIAYEERFGKPREVERPGVGTLVVTYQPNGEIKEVTSKSGGPTVAVQVASTFNSLLELVAPAGVDMGI